MADITIKVLTPATDFSLIALDELKIALGIPAGDTSEDAQLNQMIEQASSTISIMTNRVFARETVRETWRDLDSRRLYLSHWPVTEDDIESVATAGQVLDPSTYELEEQSGKLSIFTAQPEPIVVTYTGGFALPDEAVPALKQAAALLVRTARIDAASEATSGIRMISHKESRVMFFDANAAAAKQGAAGGGSTDAIDSLLSHFMRFWV